MELRKGSCFFCRCTKVIKTTRSQEAFNIITKLLPKEILNHSEFNKIQSALRFCPICYHKLIILKRTSKNIQPYISNETSSGSGCLLCKSEENLFQINNWTNFGAISEDLVFLKTNDCVTCSDCLFYLETKHEIKRKLFTKYPKLKNKPQSNIENRKKFKLKFTSNMKLHSTVARNKKSSKTQYSSKGNGCDLSAHTGINFNSLKNLRPLKDHTFFRDIKIVKLDSKFLNQIPYVLINTTNFSNSHNNILDKDAGIKSSKDETSRETFALDTANDFANIQNEPSKRHTNKKANNKSVIVKKDVYKRGIVKHLVVNVSRIKIEKYLRKCESDSDIQNLIDKFNTLRPLNQVERSSSISSNSFTTPDDSFLEEPETSFESKNKRKSVSFAEEKNVEIEYFDVSNIKSKNSNLDESSEATSKKYNKGILKHEENIGSNVNLSEQNKEFNETEEKFESLNQSNREETDKSILSTESPLDSRREKKISSRRNTFIDSVTNVNDERKGMDNIYVISDSDKSDDEENLNSKQKTKRSKAKPLSKKKRENKNVDDISDTDTNNCTDDHSANTKVKEKSYNIPLEAAGDPSMLEETNPDNEESTSKKIFTTEEDKSTPLVPGKIEKVTVHKVAQKEINFENKSDNSNSEKMSAESVEDKLHIKKSKKYRPKPLSKQKKSVDKTENVEEDISSENVLDSTQNNENISKSVDGTKLESEKLKRDKPLSEYKEQNSDNSEVIETENKSGNDLDNTKDDNSDLKEKLNDNQDITSIKETKNNSGSSSQCTDTEKSNENEPESQSNVKITNNDNVSVEKNESGTLLSLENEVNSSNSILKEHKEESLTTNNSNVPEISEDVLNKNEVDVNSKKNEKDNSLDMTDNNKPAGMSENEATELANKYLLSPDNDSFLNTREKDNSLKGSENTSFDKDSDEELTEVNNSGNEPDKHIDSIDEDRFDEFDKGEELGISEVDNENINSLLSHILPPELPETRVLFDPITDGSENESGDDSPSSGKRKISDDELNVSKEKKKKRVTFCDDVT